MRDEGGWMKKEQAGPSFVLHPSAFILFGGVATNGLDFGRRGDKLMRVIKRMELRIKYSR
jgi:hypothetical protein